MISFLPTVFSKENFTLSINSAAGASNTNLKNFVSQTDPQSQYFALSVVQGNTLSGFMIPSAVTPQVLGTLTGNTVSHDITTYIVQNGDSLWGISQKFGISLDTIVWANNIEDAIIQPGQKLTILPVSGVMYTVVSGDTISALAKKYNVTTDAITNFNNIDKAQGLTVGQVLIIPGGRLASSESISVPDIGDIPALSTDNFYGKSHAFPYGQCTWWVAQKRAIPSWGNAIDWIPNAKAQGYKTCSGSYCTPVAGAVVSLKGDPVYGHVGYVEQVSGNKVRISEMNYIGLGKVDYRWLTIGSPDIRGYIY